MKESVNPIILVDNVKPSGLTLEVVERAEARLGNDDRAGAYLELYSATGNEMYMIQAQITSYSGANGGMALGVNQNAKVSNHQVLMLMLYW